ncbi:MAG: hypothetical protein ACFE8L_06630 [Candidatus Hodarchaeota archaeon]
MEAKVKIDTNYYDFLIFVQDVSKKSNSIQRSLIKRIYENYDIQKVKNDLDKKIARIDRLLIK